MADMASRIEQQGGGRILRSASMLVYPVAIGDVNTNLESFGTFGSVQRSFGVTLR